MTDIIQPQKQWHPSKAVRLEGQVAAETLRALYPEELVANMLPDTLREEGMEVELPLAAQALTSMVGRLHVMRKSGEAEQRPKRYDFLQAIALRLAVQIDDAWEPPFDVPEPASASTKLTEVYIPDQPTSAEGVITQAQNPELTVALSVE